MWVDYRGSLSTVYNDGEISTCGEIITGTLSHEEGITHTRNQPILRK